MKAIFSLASLAAIAITILLGIGQVFPSTVEAASPAGVPGEALNLLPEGTTLPAELPSEIADPTLLAAWIVLYNHTEPIPVHDGKTITGRSLAELALQQDIPVRWGSDEVCGGSSCAQRKTCDNLACIEAYQEQPIQPVYIKPAFQETAQKDIAFLVKVLAHELYHQALPFGPVTTSLYEEYWAFYVGTQISGAGLLSFEGYNPLKQACLERWFVVYGLGAYDKVDPYPITLAAEADLVSGTCSP